MDKSQRAVSRLLLPTCDSIDTLWASSSRTHILLRQNYFIINLLSICHLLLTRLKIGYRYPILLTGTGVSRFRSTRRPSLRDMRRPFIPFARSSWSLIRARRNEIAFAFLSLTTTTSLIVCATGEEHARRAYGQPRNRQSLTAVTRLSLFRWRWPSEETRVVAPTHISIQWRV